MIRINNVDMSRKSFAKTLRAAGYDWAIVLRNSFKSALIPYWARIARRTGWLGEARYFLLNDWRKLDKARYPLMIERFMALASVPCAALPTPYPTPQLTVTAEDVQQTLSSLSVCKPLGPLLIVCPGAEYGAAKRWPAEHFAAVAKEKLQQGWNVWLLGSSKERVITEEMNQLCGGRCTDFSGRTTLNQAIDLLSLATTVVCNDSGLMHIAAALGVQLVVLYGSSSAKFTPPLSERVNLLSLNLSCSPCFKRECPLQHLNCLRQLLPTRVLEVMD